MARKGAQKRGTATSKAGTPGRVPNIGDLREVPRYVEGWRAGDVDATTRLQELGRDAAAQVARIADEAGDPALAEFARKLAVITPQLPTNMYALREAAVDASVARALREAPALAEAPPITVAGGTLGIFDPELVKEALVRRGRPRGRPGSLIAGELLVQGLPIQRPVAVQLSPGPAPEGQATVAHRLQVRSGVVFVGPPEASDGPRMGTIRLDPHQTALQLRAAEGGFVRLAPGVYRVGVYFDAPVVRVQLLPDPQPEAPLGRDPTAYEPLPRAPARPEPS